VAAAVTAARAASRAGAAFDFRRPLFDNRRLAPAAVRVAGGGADGSCVASSARLTMIKTLVSWCSVLLFVAAAGCLAPPRSAVGGGQTGSITANLALGPHDSLHAAGYAISGPGAFVRSGSIDVSHSATLSATIGGLPAGDGYTISITGTATDGVTTCAGAAPFSIAARMTALISIQVLCRAPATTGIVQINGTVDVCPVLDSIGASPGEVAVGSSIALTSTAHDSDGGPGALAYAWTVTGGVGTVAPASAQNTSFTCTSAGPATIALAVTDGLCSDGLAVTVSCTPATGAAPAITINEVESSGGVPGDWAELFNAGSGPVDLSGWVFRDNDDAHNYAIPSGTVIAAGGYFVLEEADFGFGLGAPDAARIYLPGGTTLVDSFSWTTHATTTYGRCPNGTGDFTTTLDVTKGGPNSCPGTDGDAGGAGGADAGGADSGTDGGTGDTLALEPWPGADDVVTVDDLNQFTSNLSGLFYEPATAGAPAILWGIQNGPSLLHRLLWNGATWSETPTNDWGTGKTIHYTTGAGGPDSEGVTRAELTSSAVYVSTERDNDNNGVSRLSVLRYDSAAAGTDLTATHDWNLTADLPVSGPNLGLEAITWIPDSYLVAHGFLDESTGAAYDPARYPDHGTGLFFVGLESNGVIYGYALDHATSGFQRVATVASGHISIMDLAFDRDVGDLWAYCDNTCDNHASLLTIDDDPTSPTRGRFLTRHLYNHPSTLPDSNNEGITLAPESECLNGQKNFFWADDADIDGHAIRRGSVLCGAFF
jgi:hypothetical protein